LDKLRDKFDDDTQSQRAEIKKRIQQKYERKEKAVEQELQDLK
jgi:hypothetical protein